MCLSGWNILSELLVTSEERDALPRRHFFFFLLSLLHFFSYRSFSFSLLLSLVLFLVIASFSFLSSLLLFLTRQMYDILLPFGVKKTQFQGDKICPLVRWR